MENTIFKKYSSFQKNEKFKKILIGKRGCRCEICKNFEWLNQPIHLELHHIDGDRTNFIENNLQLLCPNCHSYTDNYGSKNKKHLDVSDEEILQELKKSSSIRQALLNLNLSDAGANYNRARKIMKNNNFSFIKTDNKKENYCIDCGKPIYLDSIRCNKCEAKRRQEFKISRELLKEKIRTQSFVSIGKEYQVSDTAIKKWCIKYNLPSKKKDINSYSDKEWEDI